MRIFERRSTAVALLGCTSTSDSKCTGSTIVGISSRQRYTLSTWDSAHLLSAFYVGVVVRTAIPPDSIQIPKLTKLNSRYVGQAMWVPEGSTLRTSRGIHFYGDRDRNRNDITFAPLAQLQGRISTKVTTPIPPKAREENNLRSMRDIKVTEDLRWWPPCIDRSWPTAISVGQPKFPRSSSTATNADRVAACVGRNCGEGLGSALPLAATRLRNHVESFLEGVGGSRAEGRHLVQVLQVRADVQYSRW